MRIVKSNKRVHGRLPLAPARGISTTTNNNILSTDTHYYDNKLKDELVISTNISKLDMGPIFPEFKRILEQNQENGLYPTAIQALNLIEKDVECSGNYDSTNQFRADTILYLLYQKLKKFDSPPPGIDKGLINVIMEGLSDIITSGPCPQGRSTRLYQLYISLD